MPGSTRMRAMSSSAWWVAPSAPTVMPACVGQIFTFKPESHTVLRICSQQRPVPNTANEPVNTVRPVSARPEATPIMFCSAMPTSKRRSG